MLQPQLIYKLSSACFAIAKVQHRPSVFSLLLHHRHLLCATPMLTVQAVLMIDRVLADFTLSLVPTSYHGIPPRKGWFSRSSAESKYHGMSNASADLAWIQSVLQELGVGSSFPLLLCDNVSATYLAANPVMHNRSKHIEIDQHFIRERIACKQLIV